MTIAYTHVQVSLLNGYPIVCFYRLLGTHLVVVLLRYWPIFLESRKSSLQAHVSLLLQACI